MTRWSAGKALRISRLGPADGRFVFVPLDHSLADGPIGSQARFQDVVHQVATAGADAVVVHKGRAEHLDPRALDGTALIVHLSGSTPYAPDANAKVLVGSVEDALRVGADAVSVHVNVGSDTEAQQLADLGAVAGACNRWGVPLLVMIYPRGPRITDPHDPAMLAHVVNIAADLGADLVKTTWAAPLEALRDVVATSPIPVLVAGGPSEGADLGSYARSVMAAGCRGLAVGRRVFQHPDPAAAVRELVRAVHGPSRALDPALTGVPIPETPTSVPSRVLAGTR